MKTLPVIGGIYFTKAEAETKLLALTYVACDSILAGGRAPTKYEIVALDHNGGILGWLVVTAGSVAGGGN